MRRAVPAGGRLRVLVRSIGHGEHVVCLRHGSARIVPAALVNKQCPCVDSGPGECKTRDVHSERPRIMHDSYSSALFSEILCHCQVALPWSPAPRKASDAAALSASPKKAPV